MPVFISLLRGINVGGNKKIKMADLRALYDSLGFTRTKTLLQSGNAVFSTTLTGPAAIVTRIQDAIQQRYGFEVTVILRTADDLRRLIENHPLTAAQLEEPNKILVNFLRTAPDDGQVQAFQAEHTTPEILHFQGDTIIVFYSDGMGKSKLATNVLERKLKVTGTGRNWNTVNKLLGLAESIA